MNASRRPLARLAGSCLVLAVVLAVAFGTGTARAGGTHTTGAASLSLDVAEWSMVPSVGLLRSGVVRVTVRNSGSRVHEIVLVRTRTFAQSLPLRGDRAVGRPVAGSRLLLAPGTTRSLMLRLAPGSYMVLDNLPWHYWQGTWVALAVS